MSPLQWTETLEVGDPVTFQRFKSTVPITVIVERVTLQRLYLSNGETFSRRQMFPKLNETPGMESYPCLKPYKAESKNKLKSERKRKVLCQKLARLKWSKLTLDQAQIIYAYLKQGNSSNDKE